MDIASLKSRLASNDQEHLLKYWDDLSNEEKEQLYKELNSLDYEEINKDFKTAMQTLQSASEKIDDLLQPLPAEVCGSITTCDKNTLKNYQTQGKSVSILSQ